MVGQDADIVLWDPAETRAIRQADSHHGADYTPWEGFDVTGWPVRTILRGQMVMDGGALVGAATGGHVARGAGDVAVSPRSTVPGPAPSL